MVYSKSPEVEMVKFEGGNAGPNRMAIKKIDISLILKNNTKVFKQSMTVYACKTKYFFNYLIISYLSSNVSFSQPLGVLSFFLVMFSISS